MERSPFDRPLPNALPTVLPSPLFVTMRALLACMLLSLRRLMRSLSMVANTGLALVPLALVILVLLVEPRSLRMGFPQLHASFDFFLRILYLHFIVFFIASLAGFAVMRQDQEEQTLHYLLLSPAPRWTLITGKMLAFLSLAGALCIASLWVTYLTFALAGHPLSEVLADLVQGGRAAVLGRESLVILLALLTYGSIAMMMGSLLKSGFYALVLLAWESALPYLPSTLKQWSVMHYLQSLLPERPEQARRLFELLGAPASVHVSIIVPLVVSLIFIITAIVLFRGKECRYGES